MAAVAEAVFEVAVVGGGLVGCAAAKYLAAETGGRVVLVGPTEAEEEASGVFSCHADEARICRRLDPDAVWATLAARSMDRYAAIAAESGIDFHRSRGCLAVGRKGGPFLSAVLATAEERHLGLERMSEQAVRDRWPALRLDASLLHDFHDGDSTGGGFESEGEVEYEALYEPASTGAGDVSARRLVQAQRVLFEKRGGTCLHRVVVKATSNGAHHQLECDDGTIVRAERYLVCTNAWTNYRALLPRRLALELTTQSTRRRVFCAEVAHEFFDDMPSIVVKGGEDPFGTARSFFDAIYALSPINHAEDDAAFGGPTMSLKVGHGAYFERELKDEEATLAWYHETDRDADRADSFARCELRGALDRLIRKPRPASSGDVTGRCVIPKTKTRRPYLHTFPGATVSCCVGCNGYAAKSSDELGRLAARMVLSGRDDDWGEATIPSDAFTAVFDDNDDDVDVCLPSS